MFIIPQQQGKKFSQTNSGEFAGNIRQTKNISFVKKGYISLEKRTRNLFDSQTYTDLTTASYEAIQKMVYANSRIWVMGTKSLYYLDSTLTPTKDVAASTPTLGALDNDMCPFQATSGAVLYVANGTTLSYWNGSTWSTTSLDITSPGHLCVFENLSSIAVGSSNKVQLVDATKTKSTQLNLPANYNIRCMEWNNNRLYIGTENALQGDAIIFEWDGLTSQANYGHPVKANFIAAMKRYKNGVAFVTSNGQLMKLEGTISELANLPIYYTNKTWTSDSNFVSYGSVVTHGGMEVEKDLIYIALDSSYSLTFGDDTDDYFENDFPSGVWCYDPEVGLYHRYSVDKAARTTTGAITTANVDTGTGVITIPSAICPDTGTPVFYDDASDGAGTKIAPLQFNTKYYVIKLTSTTLKLATTYANAMAGTAITLTSTGNNSQVLSFCPNSGFGGILQPAKALLMLRQGQVFGEIPEGSKAARMLIGSLIYTTSTTDQCTAIHSVEYKQENRGYFLTPRLISENATDVFQKIIVKFKPLITAEDKIIFKYRKLDTNLRGKKLYSNISPVGTWVTSTTFTVTDITDMAVGYEIEIVEASGSGYLAHITNISAPNAGVYTITIDETVQNISATQTFYFTVENFKKISPIISTSTITNAQGYAEIALPTDAKATALELKVELRGEDVAIEELQIISSLNKKSV